MSSPSSTPTAAPATRPAQQGLHQLFEEQAQRAPNAIAVTAPDRQLTYGALDAAAEQLAGRLRADGLLPGDRVAVALPRSADAIVAVLGVLKAGGCYLPLDPEYPADRLRWMLADAGPRLIVTAEAKPAALLDADIPAMTVGGRPEAPPRRGPVEVTGEQPAYVIYTSGSTGTPKGVVVPHRGIRNRIEWERDTYPLGPGDAALHRTSLSFDISLWEVFVPLSCGARVIVADHTRHSDPTYLVELAADQGITTIALVPSLLRALHDIDPGLRSCPALRDVHCGGERLDPALQNDFLRHSRARLHNLYGPTEYSIDATYWDCRVTPADSPVPIGHPIANTRAYVLHDLSPVPDGEPGELCVAGAGLALGYHNRPELTEKCFPPDPFRPGERMYRTGDLVRRRQDGVLEFLGRLDDQVKIRGFRVELGEVEAALVAEPGVRQAAARASADGETLLGFLVPAADPLDLRATRENLARRLPAYLVPGRLAALPALPLNHNGKLDRAALPDLTATGPEGSAKQTSESSPSGRSDEDDGSAEYRVAAIFRRILGREEIGSDDDFFDLGGNSLQAARLIHLIKESLGVRLPMALLFTTSTVTGLAEAVREAHPAAD